MMSLPPVDPEVDHISGSVTAGIQLVEYGDFQCPYCRAAYHEIKQLQKIMGSRLCLVFRHFPLAKIHPHALRAAEFAEAAGTVGLFWEMHDLLFENQAALDEPSLVAYGRSIGMTESLIASVGSRFEPLIQRDFHGGVRSGVNGTPTLFINGKRFDGRARCSALHDAMGSVAHKRTS